MALSPTSLIILLIFMFIVYTSVSVMGLKLKTHCTFIRPDKTRIEKMIKAKQRRVEFDGGWYYVIPNRIILKVMDSGIYKLFPTKVSSLIYKWDSPVPLDPNTFQNSWETPEARKALNKEEDIRAYSAGNVASLAKSKPQGMLDRFFPIIVIGAVCVIGYMLYSLSGKVDMLGQAVNTLQKMMMGQ